MPNNLNSTANNSMIDGIRLIYVVDVSLQSVLMINQVCKLPWPVGAGSTAHASCNEAVHVPSNSSITTSQLIFRTQIVVDCCKALQYWADHSVHRYVRQYATNQCHNDALTPTGMFLCSTRGITKYRLRCCSCECCHLRWLVTSHCSLSVLATGSP